jgi:hypothetical protein
MVRATGVALGLMGLLAVAATSGPQAATPATGFAQPYAGAPKYQQ